MAIGVEGEAEGFELVMQLNGTPSLGMKRNILVFCPRNFKDELERKNSGKSCRLFLDIDKI